MGYGPLVGHRRFRGGPQNYSKNWLLSSKKSYFSYIYWRIDKNRGLRCADLFFGDQGKNCSPSDEDLFFYFFNFLWRSGQKSLFQRCQGNFWANNADLKAETFFSRRKPQRYGPTAMVHRAMGHGNFQKIQNEPRFRKG